MLNVSYAARKNQNRHDVLAAVALLFFAFSPLLVLTGCGGDGQSPAADPVAGLSGPVNAGDYPSINAAVANAASANITITVSSPQTLTADLVVPSN
ncbi:MAG: hypothetical protein M0Z75_01570, partial [Nitrospiraceae bacterium]|nr:hypothetical protein [Nitrospiraceae bacterium]